MLFLPRTLILRHQGVFLQKRKSKLASVKRMTLLQYSIISGLKFLLPFRCPDVKLRLPHFRTKKVIKMIQVNSFVNVC